MIYVKLDNGSISTVHFVPFDPVHGIGKTKEELEAEGGIFVESVPEPENRPGKVASLNYSEEQGLYYEYTDRPKTPEEEQRQEMEALKTENQALNTAVVELYEIVLGGI